MATTDSNRCTTVTDKAQATDRAASPSAKGRHADDERGRGGPTQRSRGAGCPRSAQSTTTALHAWLALHESAATQRACLKDAVQGVPSSSPAVPTPEVNAKLRARAGSRWA